MASTSQVLEVAIASENGMYDAEAYRYLLSRLLDRQVNLWRSNVRFNGWKTVVNQTPIYLRHAARNGVNRALVAIDNDGGKNTGPEHESDHDVKAQARNINGCRVCRLLDIIPEDWKSPDSYRYCVVVPIQALETWLLSIQGFSFRSPTPEAYYHRRALKTAFFGKPLPPEADRTKAALAELKKSDAIDILRQRRSFRYFEKQLDGWDR